MSEIERLQPEALRDHTAFLKSYSPEDEGLYDDLVVGLDS